MNEGFGAAWLNRGYALYKQYRYEEALDSTARAIDLKEDFAGAWYNRGCFFALIQKKVEAMESLTRAIALKPVYKKRAIDDPDFQGMKDEPEFIQLVT